MFRKQVLVFKSREKWQVKLSGTALTELPRHYTMISGYLINGIPDISTSSHRIEWHRHTPNVAVCYGRIELFVTAVSKTLLRTYQTPRYGRNKPKRLSYTGRIIRSMKNS
ncbi:MAG: hypothetical protein VB102_13120 [Paludibacter sp.]|nr:hypothetical protein [Paludibacter sp.]